jgi:zinc/manganese transport system substrate-binding protein
MKAIIITIIIQSVWITSYASAAVNVFACEPEWKALAEIIGGEHVNTYSATTAFQDPHHIEARPSLISKVRQADLLVCTGAELEIGWLPLLLRQSGNAAIQEGELGFFLAASQVTPIEIPTNLDRSQGDVHASGNPHVHWDPYRLLTIADLLSQRLQKIDPQHAADYSQHYKQFSAQWTSAIGRWELQAKDLRGKKVIVYHKNWSYLLQWLGIEVVGDLEPKPGIPPTSSHLARLVGIVNTEKPAYIIMANYQDDKGAQWLHQKTNLPVLRLPFTVNGNPQSDGLETLYDNVLFTLTQSFSVTRQH